MASYSEERFEAKIYKLSDTVIEGPFMEVGRRNISNIVIRVD